MVLGALIAPLIWHQRLWAPPRPQVPEANRLMGAVNACCVEAITEEVPSLLPEPLLPQCPSLGASICSASICLMLGDCSTPTPLEPHQWVTDYRAYFGSGGHLSLLTNKGTRARSCAMLQNSANYLQAGKANIQSKPNCYMAAKIVPLSETP